SGLDNSELNTIEGMQRRLAGATRTQALNLYREWIDDSTFKNEDVIVAMRSYLSGEVETVAAQVIKFKLPMNQLEVDSLSMHIYESDLAAYVTLLKRGDPAGGNVAGATVPDDDDDGDDGDGAPPPDAGYIDPDGRYEYEVEIVFLVVEHMQKPTDDDFAYLKFN
ncbi:MAG: hypothetical protein FWG45_04975, partial [Oscillospiraceae bacterium]|nr:hypothetical protein [Oscillospiraceae bacterium]